MIFRGPNASSHFIETLLKEEQEIKDILNHIKPVRMTKDDEIDFSNAKYCSICKREFDERETYKVIEHDHVTGLYRCSAHNICTLQF